MTSDLTTATDAAASILNIVEWVVAGVVVWFGKTFVSDVRDFHKEMGERVDRIDGRVAYLEGTVYGHAQRRKGDRPAPPLGRGD